MFLYIPQIVLLRAAASANLDVRPGPEHAVMMVMVLGKIVGQHFAVEAPQGMDVARPAAAGVLCRDFLVGDHAMVVDEHRLLRSVSRSEAGLSSENANAAGAPGPAGDDSRRKRRGLAASSAGGISTTIRPPSRCLVPSAAIFATV